MGRQLSAAEYDRESPFRTGFKGTCPRCGRGRLFRGFLDIVERCGVCGLDLSQQNSGDAGPFFIVMIVGFITVGLALTVEMNFAPPGWLHMVLWLPAGLILSLVLLRPVKGIMIALQYKHRVAFEHDRDET